MSQADDGGCVLNIVNGRCIITGQYWTLDWTSTLTSNGAKCPESADYPEYAPAAYADDSTDPPEGSTTPPADDAFGVMTAASVGTLIMVTGIVAAMM